MYEQDIDMFWNSKLFPILISYKIHGTPGQLVCSFAQFVWFVSLFVCLPII